jgi:imidazolonepropionase-like amidohydrolase
VNRYQLPEGLTLDETAGRRAHWEAYAATEQLIANKFIEYGVKIMAGTDANLPIRVPGFSLFDEFESLNTIGMTPAQVLRSSTSIPAEWMKNNTGSIQAGRKANLVLLDENPLEDISNTRKINSVILNGKVFDRGLLDEILAAVKSANDASRKEDISAYVHSRLEAAAVPHTH